jgi:hypothetical protein
MCYARCAEPCEKPCKEYWKYVDANAIKLKELREKRKILKELNKT